MGGQPASRPRYESLPQGEGALKAIFKTVKAGAAGLGVDRVFITGVAPIVLSDMTSGYNVAKNIYLSRNSRNYAVSPKRKSARRSRNSWLITACQRRRRKRCSRRCGFTITAIDSATSRRTSFTTRRWRFTSWIIFSNGASRPRS
jgi:hypothetical protein